MFVESWRLRQHAVAGLDPSGIWVREPPARDGFELTQGAPPGGPDGIV